MDMRKLVVASLLAASTAVASHVAAARVDVDVVIAPPAPRYEVVPAPRHGYVWAPGYWAVPPRARTTWVPGYWANRPGGFVWVTGYWR